MTILLSPEQYAVTLFLGRRTNWNKSNLNHLEQIELIKYDKKLSKNLG